MPYPALPDRRIPYDNDGTVVGYGTATGGITSYPSQSELQELQDGDYVAAVSGFGAAEHAMWWFFPEQREVTAYYTLAQRDNNSTNYWRGDLVRGSNDTTNGIDGTWETASLPGGAPGPTDGNTYQADQWRGGIKPISFTGGKRGVQIQYRAGGGGEGASLRIGHLYGEKVAGQTPDDVIYIDHDTTPGVEYTAPEDFGDQPLATTVVRQFRLKNTSATKTANTINVQCNDSDFAISTDGTTWVVTISIASLGPGAQSATMYVRCTTPAPGNLLGPRFARIVTTVASYT